jgi:putative ABC transport system permease protein
MDTILKDLRFALRTMLKHPAFSAVAIITLALGIGGSTAIFTVVDAALLRGLPFKSPEGLYHLWEQTPKREFPKREFSYPDYKDYEQNNIFEGVAAYTGSGAILSGSGESEYVAAPRVSANFFSVLGVDPMLGRSFQSGEDSTGGPNLVILTYGFWQRKFGGDAGVIGRALTINGQSFTVIGVLPASFQFALKSNDLWLPYQPPQNAMATRSGHSINLIARLKPGISVTQAQSELSVIASRIERENSQSHAGTSARLVPLQEEIVGKVKPTLFVLLAAVGLVLLIACANVASLLLTRALSRQKEVAIRSALGASRWRVIRQLLTESLLLSVVGGILGLAIAYWGVPAIVRVLPPAQLLLMPFLQVLHFDVKILVFSFALSVLTGIVFGLIPALQSSRLDLGEVLKEGGRQSSSGVGQRLRSAMVVTEVALAVVLLVGAGLLMKSLFRLLQTNVGFQTENLLAVGYVLPAKYTQLTQVVGFDDQVQERVRAVPGVVNAGIVDVLPLTGGTTMRFSIYV